MANAERRPVALSPVLILGFALRPAPPALLQPLASLAMAAMRHRRLQLTSPDAGRGVPNVQRLIDAWPDLPGPVKAGLVAMVNATAGKPEDHADNPCVTKTTGKLWGLMAPPATWVSTAKQDPLRSSRKTDRRK